MEAILNRFRVKKRIRFHGRMDQMESILEAMEAERLDKEEFYLEQVAKYQYKLEPTISFGSFYIWINGLSIQARSTMVKVSLESKTSNLQELELSGALPWKQLIIFFVFLAAFLLGGVTPLVAFGTFKGIILISLFWAVFQIWFHYVWTSQERALIEEFQLALHIRIRAGIGL